MNNLDKLVPPLELCRKIPVGKFEASALVLIFWRKSPNTPVEIRTRCEVENDPEFDDLVEDQRIIIYPAPTLQEIMEALGAATCYHLGETWTVALCNDSLDNGVKDVNPATAALKLWLDRARKALEATERTEEVKNK